MNTKTIAAVAVGTVALLAAVWQLRGSAAVPSRVQLVCISSGEVFWVSRSEASVLPAVNPQTGKASLLPCSVEEGKPTVDPRYAAIAKEILGGEKIVEDKPTQKAQRTQ